MALELVAGPKAEPALAPASGKEERSATLLASPVLDSVRAASSPKTQDGKSGAESAEAARILDPPTSVPAPTTVSQPFGPAPVSAPANELQIASPVDSTGSEPKPAQSPASRPVPGSAADDEPVGKPNLSKETVLGQTKPIENKEPTSKLDQSAQDNISVNKSRPTDAGNAGTATSNSDLPPLVPSAPMPQARLGADEPHGKSTPAVPPSASPPENRLDAVGSAAVPFEALEPGTAAPASQTREVVSTFETPERSPVDRPKSGSLIPDSREAAIRSTEPERPTLKSAAQSTRAEPTTQNLASAGWVSIPNSGKLEIDGGESISAESSDSKSGLGPGSMVARDVRAHAAKSIAFEREPSQPGTRRAEAKTGIPTSAQSAPNSGDVAEPRAGFDTARVESVPHLVERGENFWTISRLYYNSGRYYRALWKANSERYPDVNVLHVGDTIMIPPVEDLDEAYILPPRADAVPTLTGDKLSPGGPSSRNHPENANDPVEPSELSGAPPSRHAAASAARTNQASGLTDGVPLRRSSAADADLKLPMVPSGAQGESARNRANRGAELSVSNDERNKDEPEKRTSARPSRTDATSPSRPVYKVRPYDTLRSIARDTLDDPRRADEILELNRGIIDDSAHLVVGQILELPEDARTSLRRSTSRR
jgi:nucleoid-associated protein YgaU